MSVLSATATLLLFSPPYEVTRNSGQNSFPPVQHDGVKTLVSHVAFGEGGILTRAEFNSVWQSLFGVLPTDSACGRPQKITGLDADLLKDDSFLVQQRGFNPELCRAENWFVASARIDPCRIRIGTKNKSRKEILNCSQNGRYTEVRFVVQPVLKHDRGVFFPDAAFHLAFTIKDIKRTLHRWKSLSLAQSKRPHSDFFKWLRKNSMPNDVSLFVSGPGLERWSFARAVFKEQTWMKDQLAHGGFHESLSDADLNAGTVRTDVGTAAPSTSPEDFLNPLKLTPLQLSCVGCHLAQAGRPVRNFRQLGWGLSGEPVVSLRVLAEAVYASEEIEILARQSPKN